MKKKCDSNFYKETTKKQADVELAVIPNEQKQRAGKTTSAKVGISFLLCVGGQWLPAKDFEVSRILLPTPFTSSLSW